MLYAEITVRVYLDEKELTESQQETARQADIDIQTDHPIDKGISNLRDIIEVVIPPKFEYLGEGVKAVRIVVD